MSGPNYSEAAPRISSSSDWSSSSGTHSESTITSFTPARPEIQCPLRPRTDHDDLYWVFTYLPVVREAYGMATLGMHPPLALRSAAYARFPASPVSGVLTRLVVALDMEADERMSNAGHLNTFLSAQGTIVLKEVWESLAFSDLIVAQTLWRVFVRLVGEGGSLPGPMLIAHLMHLLRSTAGIDPPQGGRFVSSVTSLQDEQPGAAPPPPRPMYQDPSAERRRAAVARLESSVTVQPDGVIIPLASNPSGRLLRQWLTNVLPASWGIGRGRLSLSGVASPCDLAGPGGDDDDLLWVSKTGKARKILDAKKWVPKVEAASRTAGADWATKVAETIVKDIAKTFERLSK